ncbi:MAG: aspartate 1-decarboxylase [Lachnospiraceae bacterium]|nr:aspartate 1-decarboxylase [Lachnospiraceae bacterium]
MNVSMLKSKIHRAVVTQAETDYVGSITIDASLMEAAGILEYEKVLVADVENGNRLWTYTLAGEPNSGVICLNGAAARQVNIHDHVIIMTFADLDAAEAKDWHPDVVFVDEQNEIVRIAKYEKHGELG